MSAPLRMLRASRGVLTVRRAALRPDGVHAYGEVFGWDGFGGLRTLDRWPGVPAAGWSFDVVHYFGSGRWGVGIVVRAGRPSGDEREVPLGKFAFGVWLRPLTPANALAAFLRDEPRARPGLADPARCAELDRRLSGLPGMSRPAAEPLKGDAYDLHWAAVRAYHRAVPRRYDDRRVDTDPPPGLPELVALTREELPPRLRDAVTEDEVAHRLRRLLDRPPWPFAILLGEAA